MSLCNIQFRRYRKTDFEESARLVRDVFVQFILPGTSADGVEYWKKYLSVSKENIDALRDRYESQTIAHVALHRGRIVGLVNGTPKELKRMFVRPNYQGNRIASELMRRFDRDCLTQSCKNYRISASLNAVQFYIRMDCKKTTGIRPFHWLAVQPMKKMLR